MALARPLSFTEQLNLRAIGKDVYESLHAPSKMGNPANIAYGGYALATACKSTYLSVPAGYHLYSMMGHYLGPAYADRPLRASVRTIRQTRTFATRQVEVSQKRDDGENRVSLIAIADFHIKEPASLLEYSKPPSMKYSHYANLPSQKEAHQKLLDEGKITQGLLDAHAKTFGLLRGIYDQRPCPETVFPQNLYGMAKTLPTTQDHLTTTEKTNADWFRCIEHLPTPIDNMTNLTFFIDGAIAFLPLSFNHLWFEDIGACSSLDFALRFFMSGDEVDVGKWHLREMKTSVGSEARSYGEAWVWDEQGRAVACMSQQSILRPKVGVEKGKL
ncbi:Thioesterase/thiol ester dehydrase-isomerase [Setomelanomma holmii]|uniref:Thioesterase/thiol ester dehydrase-isomerase n=1 Tax=Setomelanomma holmii TaxID=210430 RepID=A0A9P4GYP7_9PLEO|nr:Thioesterase/thiol ester dehydrase-isomerase [Setomelanomma holmii]